MRGAVLIGSGLLAAMAVAVTGAAVPRGEAIAAHLARNPYDDSGRVELVAVCRESGDYASAYYHAAWLTWLSASAYAEADAAAGLLRDRGLRDRAARSRPDELLPITLAVEAEHLVYSTCLNGAIAQQGQRLRRDLETMKERAERAAEEADRRDPVVRLAMAHLALTLDSVIVFEGGESSDRERVSLLRSAASRAGAVAGWLPEAPGPHRLLAIIRARLAEIDSRAIYWDLAIDEATRALELDPGDGSLPELLWTLHLRAGHWDEARKWRERVEAISSSCTAD